MGIPVVKFLCCQLRNDRLRFVEIVEKHVSDTYQVQQAGTRSYIDCFVLVSSSLTITFRAVSVTSTRVKKQKVKRRGFSVVIIDQ